MKALVYTDLLIVAVRQPKKVTAKRVKEKPEAL
jgi:hypothetical protein